MYILVYFLLKWLLISIFWKQSKVITEKKTIKSIDKIDHTMQSRQHDHTSVNTGLLNTSLDFK